MHERQRRHHARAHERRRRHMTPHHFIGDCRIQEPKPHAAEFLGDQQARHAHRAQPVPQFIRSRVVGVGRAPHALQRGVLFEETPYAVLKEPLLLRQTEFHVVLLTR